MNIQPSVIHRLDLSESDPSVPENNASGCGQILSVIAANQFRELNTDETGHVIKVQVETVRGNKLPYSCIFVKVPFVPQSIQRYKPGDTIFFNGIIKQYSAENGNLLIESVNLPYFVNGSVPRDPSTPPRQGPKFKRGKTSPSTQSASTSKKIKLDDDVIVKQEPREESPTPGPSGTKRWVKKKVIVIDDDEEEPRETEETVEESDCEVIDLTKDDDDDDLADFIVDDDAPLE